MKFQLLFSGLMFFNLCLAQQAEPPKLLFREDWNELPPYDLMTPDLIQTLYGPGQDSIKKRHHGTSTDAYYVFTGFCRSNWALALSDKLSYADLSGDAVIRVRMRNSGFRELHIIIQTSNGNWFVSDQSAPPSSVWQIYDFIIK